MNHYEEGLNINKDSQKIDELIRDGNIFKQDKPNEGKITFCVENIKNLNGRIVSPILTVSNISWKLGVDSYPDNEYMNRQKFLCVYIVCNEDQESFLWSCTATIEIRLKSIYKNNDIVKNFQTDFDCDNTCLGFTNFIEWNTLVDECSQYLDDGKITIEATINVESTKGIKGKVEIDFDKYIKLPNDTVINIDGKKIHVNKEYLSLLSPVLRSMFYSGFAESNMNEILLKDIDVNDFIELLDVIKNPQKEVTKETVEILLKLGDRFDISYVIDKCEKFLMSTEDISFKRIFELIETYNLISVIYQAPSKLQF
uniref:BTB domain-containing protein n=1 Tax=Parastrongyloides trichosuri TaxID=131310 RepID=A0A0N4ZEM7_PARTI